MQLHSIRWNEIVSRDAIVPFVIPFEKKNIFINRHVPF